MVFEKKFQRIKRIKGNSPCVKEKKNVYKIVAYKKQRKGIFTTNRTEEYKCSESLLIANARKIHVEQ